jgi:C4-dicarboxylate-specific signal transduction histidine kinase
MIQQEKIVALGQMAAGISHEVMNPLANMDSLLQLAMHRPERMNADNILKLRAQIARVNAIIHQMRSLVHPDEGQLQLVHLNDAVARTIEMVGIDARARHIGIGRELSDDVGSAMIRQQSLQQVLVNLMLNSLDALAGIEQPRLLVRTARIGNRYAIEVIDNGTGIKAEHLNRVFEPFFTTKPIGKGTGLGLSISHNLIQRMGGTIQASSTPGAGTTMTIELPAAAATSAPATTEAVQSLEPLRH